MNKLKFSDIIIMDTHIDKKCSDDYNECLLYKQDHKQCMAQYVACVENTQKKMKRMMHI